MAFTFSCNNSHGSQRALYELKEKLKTAGWTVLSSGDGSGGTYSAVGDVLTTYSTTTEPVAGAVTNHRAWWLIEAPDGRQLLWQHSDWNIATDLVSVSYSRGGTFTGTDDGAHAADVAPTGTDAFLVMGERRPSSGMTGHSFGGGATITRADYIIGDADEGWAFACYLRDSSGVIQGGFFYDCLENPQAGDADPYILWSPGCYLTPFAASSVLASYYVPFHSYGDAGVGSSPTITQANGGPLGRPSRSAPRDDAAQRYGILRPTYAGSQEDILLNGGTVNPYDGADIDLLQPVWYGAAAISNPGTQNTPWGYISPIGEIKGESRFIRAISASGAQANRDTAQSLTLMAQAGGYWLRWDGATTPT